MSELWVTNVYNQQGDGAPNFPNGATVTGVVTATTFKGGAEISSGTISATSLTATTGTFSGAVSIGGTLTYEDVTNIDSVGLITARQGIKVNAGGIDITGNIGLGGANYGTAGQVLTSGGSGANATWVDAGGGAEYSGISSGAITAGRGVIVADDGKLIGVTGTLASRGTQASAVSGTRQYSALVYDTTNDKYVIFYVEGSAGKAKVGTLSGTTITWGTAVQFHANVVTNFQGLYDAMYDPQNNKCVVFFRDNTAAGKVCSGTVSGNSITFGTPVIVCSDNMESGTITYCANADHNYVIAGNDGSNSRFVANVGYNSGTNSSTWSGVSVISNNQGFVPDNCWDATSEKVIVVWSDASNSSRGKMVAGTIASNAVTWGAVQEFSSSNVSYSTSVVYHPPSGQNVIVWSEASSSPNYTYACTTTLSGTTFSLGSATNVGRNAAGAEVATIDSGAVYDATAKKVLVAFGHHDGSVYGTSVSLIIDGINITPSNGYRFQDYDGIHDGWINMVHDPDSGQDVIVSWKGGGADLQYFVEKLMATNMTATNFVGISQASYTNGQTATISLTGSVNEAVSGLTPIKRYYVIADGTLNVTADGNNILAGISLASNKLYIRGW